MASLLINSSGLTTTGTDNADLFLVQSAATSASTVIGQAGNDTVQLIQGVASADKVSISGEGGADLITISSTVFDDESFFRGGAGADTITLNGGGIKGEVALGAGSDKLIVTAAAELSTASFGAGADLLTAAVALSAANATFSMGAGADTVDLDEGVYTKTKVKMGGGADLLTVSADAATKHTAMTLAGGAGGDTITFSIEGDDTVVKGGAGSDKITQAAEDIAGTSVVLGGAGADTITLIDLSAIASAFVGGGAGKDKIIIDKAAASGSVSIMGGGGNDSISIGAIEGAIGGTVIGGAGADSITFSAELDSATTLSTQIGIQNFSDSTLDAMDIVTFAQTGEADVSGGTTLDFVTDGLGTTLRGVGVNRDVTIAAGIVTDFTSTLTDLTARVAAIDALCTTKGSVVAFMEDGDNTGAGGSAAYLFIQGGATDTLIEINEGSALSGISTLTVGNSATNIVFDVT